MIYLRKVNDFSEEHVTSLPSVKVSKGKVAMNTKKLFRTIQELKDYFQKVLESIG